MAYAFQIKYFNSFWLKKVNGDLTEQPSGTAVGNSTVTTHVNAGVSDTAVEEAYYLPTSDCELIDFVLHGIFPD